MSNLVLPSPASEVMVVAEMCNDESPVGVKRKRHAGFYEKGDWQYNYSPPLYVNISRQYQNRLQKTKGITESAWPLVLMYNVD